MLSKTGHFRIYNFTMKLAEVLGAHLCCLSTGKDRRCHRSSFKKYANENMFVILGFVRISKTCANLLCLILSRYWVKLGALATVFSMAFDPFYQAIIRIEQRPKYQNDPGAFVKRALSFDGTNCEYSKYFVH